MSRGGSSPAIGETIAQKYRVESVVGRGGMGVVVSARHVQLGHTVAIKLLTLPADEDRRDEAIARFLHEAQAAARLRSDHVVRIHDVGQLESGLPFMVMELLVGLDLGTLLDQRGPLPEAEAVDYVLQACAGVAEAHQMGIVHRDLKPANLFVTRRSDGLPLLKVLDFGISKQLTDPDSGNTAATFTSTRTLMGSPNYMSPEQIRDARRVDARADIWALGIILQELVTDAPVFHGESFPGVCAAIVADPPMPVRTMRPDVSERLEAIIERCLQKDVTRRYQNVAELAEALSPLGARASASGSGPQALVYSSHSRPEPPKKPAAQPAPLATEQTLSMPSGPEPTSIRRDGTLESARLHTRANTHSALSSPDSRISVREGPVGGPSRRSSALRWGLAGGALALVFGGTLWWQSRASVPPTVASADQVPRTPVSTGDAAFTLNITSEPSGAAVSEGSVRLGTTPVALGVSLAPSDGPRVFVLEKEGFEPFVLRQGAARGQVNVKAQLVRAAAPAVVAPQPPEPARSSAPPRVHESPAPRPAAKTPKALPAVDKPPADIRLER